MEGATVEPEADPERTSYARASALQGFCDEASEASVEALCQGVSSLCQPLTHAANGTLLPHCCALFCRLLISTQGGNAARQGPQHARGTREDAKVAQEAQRHTHKLALQQFLT